MTPANMPRTNPLPRPREGSRLAWSTASAR